MEEIKVGEYIRTVAGYIGKIINFSDGMYTAQMKDATIDLYIDDIKNHKENIIDLIQVSDYVNGYRVTDKYFFAGEVLVLETEGKDTNCKCLCNEDIKDVVTKEQFEQIKYIVGDESNE